MKRIVYAAAAVLLVAIVSACGRQGNAAVDRGAVVAAATPVAVTLVERHNLASELELSAEFHPFQEIDLHAKVSGYLKSISVDVGDQVRQGQLLAVLEVPEMDQDLALATAVVNRATAEVQRAKGELLRAEATLRIRELSHDRLAAVAKARPNLIAQQEIDDAAARVSEARAQLAASRAALAASQEQVRGVAASQKRTNTMLAYTRITAPFSGVITQRRGDPGALVQAGTASQTQAMPVVRLSQVDHLRLVLPVPESIVPRIRTGAPVEVRVDALNRVIQGRIARTNGRLDPATRTMETEVDIPNPDYDIKPGMFGTALLRLDSRKDVLAVPVQAVSSKGGFSTALVVAGGNRLEERRLKTGLETPDLIEVTANLREGELVVIGSRGNLKSGARVTPKRIESASAVGVH